MLRRICLTGCLVMFFSACAPVASNVPAVTEFRPTGTTTSLPVSTIPPITSTSTPEMATLTPEVDGAISTPSPEETQPEVTEPAFTAIPKKTAKATAIPQPSNNSGAIQLYSPGPLSKIVSPLILYGYAIPGYRNKGRVDLYGEDGRLITSELLQLNTVYKWAYFYWPLPFTISSAGELGRLSMSTQDKYGRTTAVNSIHVILLPEGASIVNPPGDVDLTERCVIEQPAQGQKLSGGILTVSGKMLPFNNSPLSISLIGRDGVTLSAQWAPISIDGANPISFHVEFLYSLQRGAWELLTVSQFDDRIEGMMYLYSQEIYLSP